MRGAGAGFDDATTVLVVEDDDLVRLVVAEMVREAGFSVVEAGDADEALVVLVGSSNPISLVLTDIRMPGSMDGVALARRLRATWPQIKIALISSHPSDADTLSCCDAFLAKPFTSQRLIGQVNTLLAAA